MALIDGINFIQYNENMVGANHPLALTDTLNRALIEFITKLDTGGGDTQVLRTNVKIASSTDIAAGVVSDDIVWFNPSSLKWEKAIDDNAVGIIDVENLMVLISGMYTFKTINNLTVGTKYYLDASTPGAITDLDSSGVLVGTAFGTGTILNVTTSGSGSGSGGSGLDADTLDGLDSTQFARTDVAEIFSSSVTASSFIGDGSQLTGIYSVNYISKNANYTASANDFIYADTSSASFIITLPANPSANARIGILDSTSNFDKNPLTIARNGNTIMGLAQDVTVNIKNAIIELIYDGIDWRYISLSYAQTETPIVTIPNIVNENATVSGSYTSEANTAVTIIATKGTISNHDMVAKTFDYTAYDITNGKDGTDTISAYATKAGELRSAVNKTNITISCVQIVADTTIQVVDIFNDLSINIGYIGV